jgi:hypothetical protein
MRRFLTLVCLLCLAIPAGISISGCSRNPGADYCNGVGYGLKITDPASITLTPQTTGLSLAFGQTQQLAPPTAKTCKGTSATVASYTYGTTNNQLVDISPGGNICAGTWNRNTGGGIANYTTCYKPNPIPTTSGLPYATAYVSASGGSVTSNPVQVYVHAQVTSVTLVGPQQCLSQGQVAQLDAQACYSGSNNTQQLLCAPATVAPANYACPLPAGVTSVPSCTTAIGTLNYTVGAAAIASINQETNQITAEQPGTTAITASVAQSGSSAGYFSTCPPASIKVTLANGSTSGIITQGVPQNLTTTVIDTQGNPITGLSLEYESTDPIDITAGGTGGITTAFPGVASVYALCQPGGCNPAPINVIGTEGTGLPITSNPVTITTPGTASEYFWVGAPGQSQYFVPVELLSGTVGAPARLPYVPNSMVMDRLGQNLYFGSSRELMVVTATSNTVSKQDTSVPGVVLAVSPNNQTVLINDQVRQLFYLYNTSSGIEAAFGGLGTAAAWTPDSNTLYITDSASYGAGHTDTLYVYNANTGWTTYALPPSPLTAGSVPAASLAPNVAYSNTLQTPAIAIPGVGAYLRGNPTVAHTWCPSGNVGNYASMIFYPQGDSVNVQTDVLAATTDGKHILGAALVGGPGPITLSDIGVTIPAEQCPGAGTATLSPLTIQHTVTQTQIPGVDAASVNQVVPSPTSALAFFTYNPASAANNKQLPYYVPGAGVNYITLSGSAAASITAPVAGAFSPDSTLFFVSTAGDDQIHYINVKALTDTQQITPGLPSCTPVADGGVDPGCTLTAPSGSGTVPATVVTVTPRATT